MHTMIVDYSSRVIILAFFNQYHTVVVIYDRIAFMTFAFDTKYNHFARYTEGTQFESPHK